MIKVIKIILAVVALLVAFIAGSLVYSKIERRLEVSSFKGYYGELAQKCDQDDSTYSCCIASLGAMRKGRYKLIENDTCKDGYTPNMMKCLGTFKWCEPVKK